MPYLNGTALFLCLILQKKSLEDGILSFYQPHIHICCERIILFLRNMFKFVGHTQFLEIRTTTKEIMLFHDNGFVLLRFACSFNWLSIGGPFHDVMVDGKVGLKCKMGSYFPKIDNYVRCIFIIRSFSDEFRSIFGNILSYLSSNIGNEGKTFNSSCNTDHRRSNSESDVCRRPSYFRPNARCNFFYSFHPCNVIYQLQTVSSRQEKS